MQFRRSGFASRANISGRMCIRRRRRHITAHSSMRRSATARCASIAPSMSRPANPYDNASCESFFKTLKREEIYATEYTDLEDLRTHIQEFIERYYNEKRLHSALGYCSPAEFEQKAAVETSSSATVRFFARNDGGSSTRLLGEETQTPSLPPDPIPASESTA